MHQTLNITIPYQLKQLEGIFVEGGGEFFTGQVKIERLTNELFLSMNVVQHARGFVFFAILKKFKNVCNTLTEPSQAQNKISHAIALHTFHQLQRFL